MTPEEFRALSKRPHKYRAKPVTIDGIRFDSTAEAKRWFDLQTLEKNGLIEKLQRQVRYPIDVNGARICTYVADFVYVENGARVVEDTKGMVTPIYALKKRLMLAVHGVEIRETGKGRGR